MRISLQLSSVTTVLYIHVLSTPLCIGIRPKSILLNSRTVHYNTYLGSNVYLQVTSMYTVLTLYTRMPNISLFTYYHSNVIAVTISPEKQCQRRCKSTCIGHEHYTCSLPWMIGSFYQQPSFHKVTRCNTCPQNSIHKGKHPGHGHQKR